MIQILKACTLLFWCLKGLLQKIKIHLSLFWSFFKVVSYVCWSCRGVAPSCFWVTCSARRKMFRIPVHV